MGDQRTTEPLPRRAGVETMGNLGDELRRAGLLSKKELNRIKHEDRVKRKQEGREAQEKADAQRRDELSRLQAEKKVKDRELESERRKEREKHEQRARVREIIRTSLVRGRGSRRFYFVTRSGSLPFITVDESLGKQLERGQSAIIELPYGFPGDFGVVPAATARDLRELDPEAVRFFITQPEP